MRSNIEKVRHADGSLDKRYVIAREHNGDPTRMWVARFAGVYIGREATQALAWALARGYAVKRAMRGDGYEDYSS